MYPFTMEIDAIQSLLELQGSKFLSPPSEMDIADILAAEALMKLRGSSYQCLPKYYENQENVIHADPNLKPKVDKANQTEIILESSLPTYRSALTEIQNVSTPVKAVIPKIECKKQLNLSVLEADSRGSNDTTSAKMTERRPMRRKRVRRSTSESSDHSVEESPRIYLQTPKTCGKDLIGIGEGNAMVPKELLKTIKWDSYRNATRKLLTAVFPRNILATHSLTGKRSPAFPNKAAKEKLDPHLVNDIVKTVVAKCGVAENIVRITITTKCADESKMLRNRQRQEGEDEED